jgi:hypothetical protein
MLMPLLYTINKININNSFGMTVFPLLQILLSYFVGFRALFQSSESIISLCGICGGQSGTVAGFSMRTSVSPASSYSTNVPFSHLSSGACAVD